MEKYSIIILNPGVTPPFQVNQGLAHYLLGGGIVRLRRILILAIVIIAIGGIGLGTYFFVNRESGAEGSGYMLAPELEWLGKEVPKLPEPKGKVVYVDNVNDLYTALEEAEPYTTIILKEGTYVIGESLTMNKEGITLMGESYDRSKVVLRGLGFFEENFGPTQGINIAGGGVNVTIANMTLTEFNIHAIAVQGWQDPTPHGLHVFNVAFINNGRQNFKCNGGPIDRPAPENGIIEYCYFEQTYDIPVGRDDSKGGDYTGGIDCHKIKNWIIRDNVFKNIHGAKGGADAAIFVWNHSSGTIIERNVIIGCDKGIGVGNPGGATNYDQYSEEERYHHKGGIVRNNFIYAPDIKVGIEAFDAPEVKIYNNTVVSETGVDRAIQYGKRSEGLTIKNNIVAGEIVEKIEATGEVTVSSNIVKAPIEWFTDAVNGDLRLTEAAQKEVGQGENLGEVTDDLFGKKRPAGKIDLGAWQFTK